MSYIYLDFSPKYDSPDNLLPPSRRSRRSPPAAASVGIRASALDLQKEREERRRKRHEQSDKAAKEFGKIVNEILKGHLVGFKDKFKCFCGDVEHGIYWQEQYDRIKRRKERKEKEKAERKLKEELERKQQEEQLLKEKERREQEEQEKKRKVHTKEKKVIAIVPSAPLLTRPSFLTEPIEEEVIKQVKDAEFSCDKQVINHDPCLVEDLDIMNGERIFQEAQEQSILAIGLMKGQPDATHVLKIKLRTLKDEFKRLVFDPGGHSTRTDSRSNPLEEGGYDMNPNGATSFWVHIIEDRRRTKLKRKIQAIEGPILAHFISRIGTCFDYFTFCFSRIKSSRFDSS